jgi:head-tail adaptor
MSLQAGARDRLVTIQALTDTVDAEGVPVEGWADLTPPEWMWKQDAVARERAAERFDAMQWAAHSYTEWECGFRADLDPEVIDLPKRRRLVFRDRIYNILQAAVLPHEDGHGIKLITLVAL